MTWIASETKEFEVASYDNQNREFDGAFTYRAIAGCGLPPSTCFDIPGSRPGFVAVRNKDSSGWDYVEDHRGEVAFRKETGEQTTIHTIGPLPDSITVLKPETKYDKWDGLRWVTDEAAMKADQVSLAEDDKARLSGLAEDAIKPLERAKSLGIATSSELLKLTEWERYSVLLMRVDTSLAPNIEWPQKPQ